MKADIGEGMGSWGSYLLLRGVYFHTLWKAIWQYLLALTHSHNKSTYSLYTIETQHMNTRKFARHVTTALLIIEIILQNKRSVQKNKWIMKR